MTQNETRALEKMAAAAGKATENERPQLSSEGANKPSGNSVSLSNSQEQEVIPFNPTIQRHAHPEQRIIPQEQQEHAQETQHSDIAIQGAQAGLDCKFCSTIVGFFNSVCSLGRCEREKELFLGQVRDLLSSNCSHTTWLQNVKFGPGPDPLFEAGAVRLIQGPAERTWARLWITCETEAGRASHGTAPFELIRRPEVHVHQGRGRILDENWIDMEVIRDWRSRCIVEHGGRCDKPAFGGGAPFLPSWLIDVVEGCIVPCEDEGPRFLTLSYTWGKTKNFLTKKHNINDVRKPGALLTGYIADNIPETIRNAIALTKALGETRLWVDSLCIVQDDEAALQHDIRNMHRIYASSFLTIIAEDGQDAEFGLRGLRGLSAPRVVDQEVLPMAAGERLLMIGSKYRDHPVSIYDYEERMWTFQERIFAKRRLIFTSFGSVKWQCNCVEWDEHLHYHAEREIVLDKDVTLGLKSRIPSLDTIVGVVRDFNVKSLTYDEDVLSAFSGIQTHLEGIFPSGFLFGHPEFFFDISLCWSTWSDLRRRTVSDKFTGDPIHNGLPSWSWMGWQGKTLLPSDCEHTPGRFGFTESVTKWHCAESPSSTLLRPIDTRWHDFKAAAAERELDIDGWSCLEVEPPSCWYGHVPGNAHFTPCFMPKQLPKRIYRRHGLEDEGSKGLRWYPVPLKSEDVRPAEDGPEKPQLFQLIRCETTRAFLTGKPEVSLDTWKEGDINPIHPLIDDAGNVVGALLLHNWQDRLLLEGGRKVELVAVVKGWTSLLSGQPTWSNESQPWISEWERRRQEKSNCVFILWITWDHGIAYRKAFGFVLSQEWEELKEPENIDLILG